MGTKLRRFPWLLALLLFLLPATAAAWSGKVVGVIDGDSITVLHDGRQEQIRLWGIDCPEKWQDFGGKAKNVTSVLAFAKVVDVEPVTTDRYGRTVALVKVGNTLVNEELIRQGARLGVHPLLRPADLRGMEEAGGGGAKGEARPLVDAEAGGAVGV